MEKFFRRTMLLSRGDPLVFLERPGSAALLVVSALLLVWAVLPGRSRSGKKATQKYSEVTLGRCTASQMVGDQVDK